MIVEAVHFLKGKLKQFFPVFQMQSFCHCHWMCNSDSIQYERSVQDWDRADSLSMTIRHAWFKPHTHSRIFSGWNPVTNAVPVNGVLTFLLSIFGSSLMEKEDQKRSRVSGKEP